MRSIPVYFLSLLGLAEAQQPVVERIAPPVSVALRAPERSRTVDARREGLWQQCVVLRQRLGLPAKARADGQLLPPVRRARAMREISAGLELARDAQRMREEQAVDRATQDRLVRRREQQVLSHFRTAIVAHPASVEALLALANTTANADVARLALQAPTVTDLVAAADGHLASLLVALLAHGDEKVGGAAFVHLQWVLDAIDPEDPVFAELAARTAALWARRRQSVHVGVWDPSNYVVPDRASVLPFTAPSDLTSRLVVLAALRGDAAVLDRMTRGDLDPRAVLHCYSLAAPRVAAELAKRLFTWYSRHVKRWEPSGRTGLNTWEFGVVGTLVGVLPKLPAVRMAWYEKHLSTDRIGAAAGLAAQHRIERLALTGGRSWLRLSRDQLAGLEPWDALRLWRYLGSHQDWSLAGCLQAAPLTGLGRADRQGDVRREFVRHVLVAAPLGESQDERKLLSALWRDRDPVIARACARRAMMLGESVVPVVLAWLQRAAAVGGDRAVLAMEVAIAFRLPLLEAAWSHDVPGQRSFRRMYDACDAAKVGGGAGGPALAAWLATAPNGGNGALLRARLHTAGGLAHWPESLAQFVAQQTTHADADTRWAAYRALRGPAAQSYECSWLAGEFVFDVDLGVRRLLANQ